MQSKLSGVPIWPAAPMSAILVIFEAVGGLLKDLGWCLSVQIQCRKSKNRSYTTYLGINSQIVASLKSKRLFITGSAVHRKRHQRRNDLGG